MPALSLFLVIIPAAISFSLPPIVKKTPGADSHGGRKEGKGGIESNNLFLPSARREMAKKKHCSHNNNGTGGGATPLEVLLLTLDSLIALERPSALFSGLGALE